MIVSSVCMLLQWMLFTFIEIHRGYFSWIVFPHAIGWSIFVLFAVYKYYRAKHCE